MSRLDAILARNNAGDLIAAYDAGFRARRGPEDGADDGEGDTPDVRDAQWIVMAAAPAQIAQAFAAQRPGPARGGRIDTDAFLRAVGGGLAALFATLLLANAVVRAVDEYRERQSAEQVQRLRAECDRLPNGQCRVVRT